MKKIFVYSFTVLTALLIVVACRKSDNPKIPALTRVPQPQFTKDATTDAIIAAQNPDAFSAKFTVGLYFASDALPQKMDIMIEKNGDPTKVKTLQANVTTFPSTITVTGTQIKSLFGSSSVLGDYYDIGATITTQDGTVVPAFSALGTATSYNSGVTTEGTGGAANTTAPVASPQIRYAAVCKFTMSDYGAVGTDVPYTVVTDGWGDYNPGNVINVHIIDATHLSFVYGANNAKPIIIAIDPNTNATSVAKQVYGDYGDSYGNYSVASVTGNVNNVVTPCELGVSVYLNHTVSAGSFGNFQIKFKKK